MKIQMICVGKIKETYLRELIDHYTKIIRKKYNFEIIELPDEKTPDNASDKEESKIKEIEGQRILDFETAIEMREKLAELKKKYRE